MDPRQTEYFRPIVGTGHRPSYALSLAGGPCWFDQAERLQRGTAPERIAATDIPAKMLARLTAARTPIAGLTLDRVRLMGVVNVTPDSFSDGGLFLDPRQAVAHGRALVAGGADLLDIGGESTRPGAEDVAAQAELARVRPVIAGLAGSGAPPLSIDTRKAAVAEAALEAGAALVNDVSALSFDAALGPVVARRGVPVCLMHAKGAPKTMQDDPRYGDVLLDVYDALAAHLAWAEALGIPRERILLDPGIGFGKTLEHNLALLRGISLFHGLGCAILVGASRKRFIGTLGGGDQASERVAGSIAVALAMADQGVQVLRVHDVADTRQALTLHHAITGAGDSGT